MGNQSGFLSPEKHPHGTSFLFLTPSPTNLKIAKFRELLRKNDESTLFWTTYWTTFQIDLNQRVFMLQTCLAIQNEDLVIVF